MLKNTKNILLFAAAMLVAASLFCYPQAVLTGASRGLSLCGNVLIPSLLPFLALVGVCMRSPLADALGKVLKRPTLWLFRLPEVAAAPILFSFIGGYPAGAAAIKTLLDEGKLTAKEAARMLHFTVNAGPAFAVSAVGGVMLGNTRAGWVLLLAHLLSALCIGIAEARFTPCVRAVSPAATLKPMATAVVEGVNAATKALLYMGGFVILFSVALAVADGAGIAALLDRCMPGGSVMLAGVLEVTAGCMAASGKSLWFLLGFFLSFGGLSVHCQVRALLHDHAAALKDFFAFRLLHGLLGGGCTVLLFYLIPFSASTLTVGGAAVQPYTVSPAVSLALLCMCVAFVGSEKKIAKGR